MLGASSLIKYLLRMGRKGLARCRFEPLGPGRRTRSRRDWNDAGMARMITVDDPADPRLDDFRDLTTADRRPDRPGGRGQIGRAHI